MTRAIFTQAITQRPQNTPFTCETALPTHRAAPVGARKGSLLQGVVRSRGLRYAQVVAAAAPEAAVEAAAPTESAEASKKLRIKLKSFEVEPMKLAVSMILDAAKATGARIAGPVPLPTKRRLYCVLRSPHVDKDSREHFEIRIHSRLIDVRDLSAETIDKLMELDIPAGVEANIKIM